MEEKKYIVTKKFVDGILDGLTVTEETSVKFEIGRRYGYYIVTDIREV